MANRCYLYSCNVIPGENESEKKLIGISEWDYDVPIVFKLLLSGNTQVCKSSIWDIEEKIAIVGDYDYGVKMLSLFLEEIDGDEAKGLVSEAKSFLNDEANKQNYLVLECGELFEMNDKDFATQNLELLNEIDNLLDSVCEALSFIKYYSKPKKRNVFQKFFSRKQEREEMTFSEAALFLGLGNWSNSLYFDFSNA